ncbi:hypothetical protein K450DRAFT_241319 [Umbelopsis ramanniana AG]|uniref:Nucleoporin-domain-containing protein n=1 Tax=Umbelopsis ramanniana AG TaxID=1314678 RepID=A0AAD5E8S2_UMBRA|nr:uncharacterized protein K450DRAFT_241319 [Umbelopsis ramanniana AG]KAI8579508.1 hypothetical protein K450DRAFT_241319 [Umbelopsis ramanniana AG]
MGRDSKYPDLADLLMSPTSGEYEQPLGASKQPFMKAVSRPLPDVLSEQLKDMHCRSFMGLFPEIDRAWITFDHRLFLWNYVDGYDFVCYEDQDQVIVCVGLVKPKPEMMIDNISHVLVIATPLEVILLGVSAGRENALPGNTLYTTYLSVPSDNVSMTSIHGSSTGRIFMTGSDGHVYEMEYQQNESWFRKRCRLINHTSSSYARYIPTPLNFRPEDPIKAIAIDTARNVLYMLSKKSNLEVVYLSVDDKGFTRAAKNTEVCKSAQLMCPTSPLLETQNFELVSIHPISERESKKIHLVAVTSTGCRLYFTHHRNGLRNSFPIPPSTPPNALELVHVRIPPSQQNGRSLGLLGRDTDVANISITLYEDAVFLAAKDDNERCDTLITAAPDTGKIMLSSQTQASKMPLAEFSNRMELPGKTWAIAEYLNNTSKLTDFGISELGAHLAMPPRQFLVLGNNGLTSFVKQRPVDTLQQLLIENSSNLMMREKELTAFFQHYGRIEACAMCLEIVCFNSNENGEPANPLSISAADVFYQFGGEPTLKESSYPSVSNDLGRPLVQVETSYSGRHDGLALYLARVVRPAWKQKLFEVKPTEPSVNIQGLIGEHVFTSIQKNLAALKKFMDSRPSLYALPSPSESKYQSIDRRLLQPLLNEQQSLHDLYQLLGQCIEAIFFIQNIFYNNPAKTFQSVSPDVQNRLKELTLENILITEQGRLLTRELATIFINSRTGQASNRLISDALQAGCSTFCNANDITYYKAVEFLKLAKDVSSEEEREASLQRSLELFKNVAGIIPYNKLREICLDYRNLGFAVGGIQLALACARAIDPQNSGTSYFDEGKPTPDPREATYSLRCQCYSCVFDLLVDAKYLSESRKETVDRRVCRGDPIKYKESVFGQALASDDRVFHFELYEWFLREGMTQELLEVNTPYVIPYLRSHGPFFSEKSSLLWQYYRRNGRHDEAAICLKQLATSDAEIDLNQRVEYLSTAIENARSFKAKSYQTDITNLLRVLEETMEIAEVQVEIRQVLQQTMDLTGSLAVINTQLLTVTELYHNFAEPFNMLEQMLLIFKVSNNNDLSLTTHVWTEIIRKNEEFAKQQNRSALASLSAYVRRLGQRFFPSRFAFPLDVLCEMLEQFAYSYIDQVEPGWVINTMRSVGVPYEMLFEAYLVIFDAKRPAWRGQHEIDYLLTQILYLTRSWLDYLAGPSVTEAEKQMLDISNLRSAINNFEEVLKNGPRHLVDSKVRKDLLNGFHEELARASS